jgi:hypothetical protein
MSVIIAEPGVAAFTSASTAWRSAQTSATTMLGPAAAATLDQWLDLHAEIAGQRKLSADGAAHEQGKQRRLGVDQAQRVAWTHVSG